MFFWLSAVFSQLIKNVELRVEFNKLFTATASAGGSTNFTLKSIIFIHMNGRKIIIEYTVCFVVTIA
jgi:hypothetical protein